MINPYEAPQTIAKALPQASVVSNVPAELQVLAIGTAHCARAGWLYLIGCGGCFLFVLCRFIMEFGYRDDPRLIIPMVFCMVTGVVMLGWGMLKNLTGLINLRRNFPKPEGRRIFSVCTHLCWIKLPVAMFLLTIPFYFFMRNTFGSWLQEFGPFLAVISIGWLTIYWQTRGMNSLVQILGAAPPRFASMLYWISGCITILTLVLGIYFLQGPRDAPWYLVVVVIIGGHLAAYTRVYGQLSRAFCAEVVL